MRKSLQRSICNNNPGKDFEDRFEQVLLSCNIMFTREGSKRNYGVSASNKGKFDFLLDSAAVECKSINKDTDLSLPLPGRKSPKIAQHQLKALREFKGISGLLIEVRSKHKLYWLTMPNLDQIFINNGIVKNLLTKYLDKYAVELENLEQWTEIYRKEVLENK